MAEKEYIERQTARNVVLGFERYTGIDELPIEFAEAEIDKLPAADVAPVVRCKDCEIQQYCKVAQYLGADGFCSNGEKVDGNNG